MGKSFLGIIASVLLSAITVLLAYAQDTPSVSVWADVNVAGVTETPFGTGLKDATSILAPDGEHYARYAIDAFCLYQRDADDRDDAEKCIEDLEEIVDPVDLETMRWSPDSRYVVFTEDYLELMRDPDIWVWDTVENELDNLTDDGQIRPVMNGTSDVFIDVVPTFLPDGRILFLRYPLVSGQVSQPHIYTVRPDGSDLTMLGELRLGDSGSERFVISALDASAEQLVFVYVGLLPTPNNGVWISNLDGTDARQIVQTEPAHIPASVELSPDERYVLLVREATNNPPTSESSQVFVFDVALGELLPIDPERFVAGAGWSPEGSTLLYLTYVRRDETQTGLYVSASPGTVGRLLLEGHYTNAAFDETLPLTWGANGTVLLVNEDAGGIDLVHMASE